MNSPTRLHPSSSSSPQDPNFPGRAHPCPHLNQQRADDRPSNPAPNSSATEVSRPTFGMIPAPRPLPNPLSPQRHDVHTRAPDPANNSADNPAAQPPHRPRGLLARTEQRLGLDAAHLAMFEGVAMDGIATPGSLYYHSRLYGTPYADPTPFNPHPRPAANRPQAAGPSRERSSRSPNATATSPTPRRRHSSYRPTYGSPFRKFMLVVLLAPKGHSISSSSWLSKPWPY